MRVEKYTHYLILFANRSPKRIVEFKDSNIHISYYGYPSNPHTPNIYQPRAGVRSVRKCPSVSTILHSAAHESQPNYWVMFYSETSKGRFAQITLSGDERLVQIHLVGSSFVFFLQFWIISNTSLNKTLTGYFLFRTKLWKCCVTPN